jgi:hypothetical protein
MDVAAREHVGELVADQFADAKLALRAARRLITMLVAWHCFAIFVVKPGLNRAFTL